MINGRKVLSVGHVSTEFREAREKYVEDSERRVSNLYQAAQQTRFTRKTHQVASSGSGEDAHYASESDFFRIMEIARDIDRNDMVVGQGISRGVNNIIQGGFRLDPKTGNKGADRLIADLWEAYSTNPADVDFERDKDFSEIEQIVLRAIIVDGDILSLPLSNGPVQTIEAHRLRTPRKLPREQAQYTVHGVQLNANRQRVKYWICKDDIPLNAFPNLSEVTGYAPYDDEGNRLIHHLYHPKRMTQTRGVSKLAPVTTASAMHNDIQFSKLVQQQSVSVWSMARERPLAFQMPPGVREPGWTPEPDPCRPGETRPMRNVSAGMIYTGYPGETIKGFSPNVPNPTFFDHALQMMQIIAINLDLPLILFLLDAGETNFSGWRGAMDQAKVAFKIFQQWYARKFHRQIFTWKMRQWSTAGTSQSNRLLVRLRTSGVNVFGHDWVLPTWPYIEPLKDSTADLIDLQNGSTSPRRVQQKRGRDWDDVSTEIVEDVGLLVTKAMDKADEINKQHSGLDDPVKWRELCPFPLSEGRQMALQEAAVEQLKQDVGSQPNEPQKAKQGR